MQGASLYVDSWSQSVGELLSLSTCESETFNVEVYRIEGDCTFASMSNAVTRYDIFRWKKSHTVKAGDSFVLGKGVILGSTEAIDGETSSLFVKGSLDCQNGAKLRGNVYAESGSKVKLNNVCITDCLTIGYGASAEIGHLEATGGVVSVSDGADVSVARDATIKLSGVESALYLEGMDLGGMVVSSEGALTLSGCYGSAVLNIDCSQLRVYDTISVNGCDLSSVTINLIGLDKTDENMIIDFSGNYWGTTNMKEIKSMINGYDASRIWIFDSLDAPPSGMTTLPPEVTLLEPQVKPLKNGMAEVTFRWECNKKASYCLMVDGKEYKVNGTSCKLKLADGKHSYSVMAIDSLGYTGGTEELTIELDATAPVLTLDKKNPVSIKIDVNKGTGHVTINASCEESTGVTYTVTLDKNSSPIYEGTEMNPTLSGVADGKHSFTITARDEAGNETSAKGNFSFDATAPTLTLNTTKLKANKKTGLVNATLSWKAESGCTYVLNIDGEEIDSPKNNYTHSLEDGGSFTWQVTAYDKAGNYTTSEQCTVSVDLKAPELSELAHSMALGSNGLPETTLSWNCEDASAVSHIVKIDGKVVGTVNGTGALSYTHSAALKPGKHSYEIISTDELGNKASLKGSAFTTPKLTLGKPVLNDGAEDGTMTALLKWQLETGVDYTISVDGGAPEAPVDTAAGDKFITHELSELRDGMHSYRVTAYNRESGTYSVAEGFIEYDNTAPTIILGAISGTTVSSKGKTYTKACFSWSGEDGVKYTVKVDGKKTSAKKLTVNKVTLSSFSVTTANLEAGEHQYEIIAKDKAGNENIVSGCFSVNAQGDVSWGKGSLGAPLEGEPSQASILSWGNADTDGFSGDAAAGKNGYLFELAEARQLDVKLSGLSEHATVQIQQVGGCGSIALSANAGTSLDRELSLSAGSYCLQVVGADGQSLLEGSYTLDLELEKSGSKQPFAQAHLA